ncbi:TrmH family RNA methyltransferase [Opitutaceae bacterium TAV4]|nr:TrmH family RNA methyltransferase [Opitutaceae bacterium TAV3]RRK01453.1 TrmH family RNA methyltransferase [Opitutaceae bacterium TAV4]
MSLHPTIKQRGYLAIGLHDPKMMKNIAGVLRACGCYEAAMLAVSGTRYRRHRCDTIKHWKSMPMLEVEDLRTVLAYGCTPVAVDLVPGAVSLVDYKHPVRAFYIFGAEDGTLDDSVLSWCTARVMVPTRTCMNLASCVNVVLYDRLQKQLRARTSLPDAPVIESEIQQVLPKYPVG